MRVITAPCASFGGKFLRLQVDTTDNYGSGKTGTDRVRATAVPAHQYFLKNNFKPFMSKFYACSTYANQIIFKTKSINCLQVLCKKPNLCKETKKCM